MIHSFLKKPKTSLVIIVLVVITLGGFWLFRDVSSLAPVEILGPLKKDNTFSQRDSKSAPSESLFNANGLQSAVPSKDFKEWINNEVLAVESTSNNGSDLNALVLKAKALTQTEQFYLVRSILDSTTPASLKIFSAYLLGLSGSHNFEALQFLVSQALTTPEGRTHSPEETLSMQEKALRRMLIESLLSAWQKGEITFTQMETALNRIPDEILRQYAFKRINEIKNEGK